MIWQRSEDFQIGRMDERAKYPTPGSDAVRSGRERLQFGRQYPLTCDDAQMAEWIRAARLRSESVGTRELCQCDPVEQVFDTETVSEQRLGEDTI